MSSDKPMPAVYEHWRQRVIDTYNTVRDQAEANPEVYHGLNQDLAFFRNVEHARGEDFEALVAGLSNDYETRALIRQGSPLKDPDVWGRVDFGSGSDSNIHDHLVALYTKTDSPLKTIFHGIPSEETVLASQSTLVWSLNSRKLQLDSGEPCRLFAHASMALPQVAKGGNPHHYLNLVLQSSVEAVVEHFESQNKECRLPRLIYNKLALPFIHALHQNAEGAQIKHLVLGSITLPGVEASLNSLLAQQFQTVLNDFDGLFETVTLYVDSYATQVHVDTMINGLDE